MATYKGIGYDTATGRTRTGTNSDDISFDSLVTATDGVNVTGVGLTVGAGGANVTGGTTSDSLTVTNDASVGGSLTVSGDIISRGAVDLVVQDNFIDLNFANSTTVAEAGGLTIQMNRTASFTAGTITTFVAGVAGVSNPTFTFTDAGSSTALAAGDVVIIDGAADAENNGIYVVSAVNQSTFPQTVTIKGVGTVATNAATPFAQTQFTAASGNTATGFKTDIFVQLVADGTSAFTDPDSSTFAKGTFLTAFHANATESDFSADGGYSTVESTLQSAYNGGNSITTAGSNPITFDLSSDAAGFSVQGGSAGDGNVSIGGTNAVNSFVVAASGAASSITSAGQNLSLATTTSGEIDITSAGNLDLNGVATTIDGSAGVSIGGSGAASDFTSDGQKLTLQTTTSGELEINAAGSLDINASAGLDLDASGAASSIASTGQNLTIETITSGTLAIDAVAELDLTAAGLMDINANLGLDIDATGAASSIRSTGQNLTIETATSGTLALDAVAELDLTAAGLLDVNANLGLDMDLAGAASDISSTSQNLTIKTVTAGNLALQVLADTASAQELEIAATNANASNDGKVSITGDLYEFAFNSLAGTGDVTATDVLVLENSSGTARGIRADANSGLATKGLIGVAKTSRTAGQSLIIQTGGLLNVTADATVAAAAIGGKVYVSTTAGKVSETIPSTSGDVVYEVGVIVRASGSTAITILWAPKFVMEIG